KLIYKNESQNQYPLYLTDPLACVHQAFVLDFLSPALSSKCNYVSHGPYYDQIAHQHDPYIYIVEISLNDLSKCTDIPYDEDPNKECGEEMKQVINNKI